MTRDYVEVRPGNREEVNIWGKGVRDGQELAILGEAKSQLKKKEVDALLALMRKLTPHASVGLLRSLISL